MPHPPFERSVAAAALTFMLCASAYALPGDIDPTFGVAGLADIPSNISATDAALQADDKIVVVGGLRFGFSGEYWVVRFAAGGSVDGTFGTGGVVQIQNGKVFENAGAVAVQSDGKILVAGGVSDVLGARPVSRSPASMPQERSTPPSASAGSPRR